MNSLFCCKISCCFQRAHGFPFRIKINMLPPRRSSPRSPVAAYISQFTRRTPTASPLSPYHHTSRSHSPVSPNVHAAGLTSTISKSPGKSSPSSPANYAGLSYNSPASNRVSGILFSIALQCVILPECPRSLIVDAATPLEPFILWNYLFSHFDYCIFFTLLVD